MTWTARRRLVTSDTGADRGMWAARMQRFFGVVAFLAMDCEATPENAELAARQDVRAFPTFEVYHQGRRIEQVGLTAQLCGSMAPRHLAARAIKAVRDTHVHVTESPRRCQLPFMSTCQVKIQTYAQGWLLMI